MHIARLLASEQGLLKGVGAAQVVPVINMVDDSRYEASALEAAHAALALTLRFLTAWCWPRCAARMPWFAPYTANHVRRSSSLYRARSALWIRLVAACASDP